MILVGLIFAWAQGALYACCALFVLALCGVNVPRLDIAAVIILFAALGRGLGFIVQFTICDRREMMRIRKGLANYASSPPSRSRLSRPLTPSAESATTRQAVGPSC